MKTAYIQITFYNLQFGLLLDISTFKSMHDGIPGPYRAVKLFDGDVMGNVTKIIFNTPNRKKIMGNFIVV